MELAVDERQTARTSLHHGAVARVIEAMRQELATTLSLNEMADIACFSPFHFNRLFKKVTGRSPHLYLFALRLGHAKRFLISSDLSAVEICFEVGYNSPGGLAQKFTALVGLSPSAFRILTADIACLLSAFVRLRRGRIVSSASISGATELRVYADAFQGNGFKFSKKVAIAVLQPPRIS